MRLSRGPEAGPGPAPVADLHVHTTASDGVLSPEAVVEAAAARGLAAVGITDHDTIAGIGAATRRAAELSSAGWRRVPVVVPGVEINTDFGLGEIHILGYFVEWRAGTLARTLERLREGRRSRVRRIAERLGGLGMVVDLDRIVSSAEEGSVGRPHVARALVEAGYVRTAKEAFEKYLARGKPAYVGRERFTPREAVRAVLKAGGVAVLAHPAKEATRELVGDLVAAGLEGIEVHHPDHDRHLVRYYLALAKEQGLVVTGGSDSHGPGAVHGAAIGSYTVGYDVVEELRRRSERRRVTQGGTVQA